MDQCYRHLSIVEREEISRGSALGQSVRAIARRARRGQSTEPDQLHLPGRPPDACEDGLPNRRSPFPYRVSIPTMMLE